MKILFYYPDKERSISLASLMIAFKKQGHEVYLLTHADRGELHQDIEKMGVFAFTKNFSKSNSILYYIKHIYYLVNFIKSNKIDVVYSHIQLANIISSIASLFTKAKVILCRHHSDCAFVDNNRKELYADKLINWLGNSFIVPSLKVQEQMVQIEGVSPNKTHLIRYGYDFEMYDKPSSDAISEIRKHAQNKFLIGCVGRMIPEKRQILLLESFQRLKAKGFDAHLMFLGDGVMRTNLENYVSKHGLNDCVHFMGYRKDVINYIAASDVIVHVSESEASSSLAKEAGLLSKPIILCEDVGDFSEYIRTNYNGILIPKQFTLEELESAISWCVNNKELSKSLGIQLNKTILELFSIEAVLPCYNEFNK